MWNIEQLIKSYELEGGWEDGSYSGGVKKQIINCLKNSNIFFVDHLIKHSQMDLLKLPHLGSQILKHLIAALAQAGLELSEKKVLGEKKVVRQVISVKSLMAATKFTALGDHPEVVKIVTNEGEEKYAIIKNTPDDDDITWVKIGDWILRDRNKTDTVWNEEDFKKKFIEVEING